MLTETRLADLRTIYRDGLLLDTVPFWFPRCVDAEHGGYFTGVDRDGTVIQPDKSVWFQGRAAWTLSTLYNTVEQRPEWLEMARSGIEFMDRHCYDADGRMFFSVTRDGRALRKRRYVFSEAFATIALAAYGIAAGDESRKRQALDLFRLMLRYLQEPGLLDPKVDTATRPMKALAVPMILIATAQELRKAIDDPLLSETIDRCVAEIARDFLKPEFRCALETVGPGGEFIDTLEGRMVCPGHSIEAGWFVLQEARHRGGDAALVELGTRIIDWSMEIGWDREHGGVLYYRDARGLPCTEYWHDMKFWWPHNEAIIATLLAARMTGDPKYGRWHTMVHDWAYTHFTDPLHGEWFGYLHRDGSVSTQVKGTMWKGPFHLPRMQWFCWKLLDEWIGA
jgi:N-acylglucosamine 2-epimerase